jgi:hypothetical protein
MQFTIAKDGLENLRLICDKVKGSLDLITKDPEALELIHQLTTAADQAVSAVAADSEILRGKVQQLETELSTARSALDKLDIIKKQLANHRSMLAKIARMKIAAGARNMEAATAAASFLAQNPATI